MYILIYAHIYVEAAPSGSEHWKFANSRKKTRQYSTGKICEFEEINQSLLNCRVVHSFLTLVNPRSLHGGH
jgi:hypothetical protein